MPIRKLTPEEEAAKELKDKSPLEYIKEGKTPEEARMTLRTKPFVPTLLNENGLLNKVWNDYQESFVY
mgnify:CR=1 FL=1